MMLRSDKEALNGDGTKVRLYLALLMIYAGDSFANVTLKTTLSNRALLEAWAVAEHAFPGLKHPSSVLSVDIDEMVITPSAEFDFRA